MEGEKQLVGVDLESKSLKLEGQDLVGEVSAKHVGKIGWVRVKLEGGIQFLPLVNKAVDKLEELIPGDQKSIAAALKLAVSNIKLKF